MREQTTEYDIWDEGQLGAVVGVLGTVDQLNIDKSTMQKVKTYHRNLAVEFYDYKMLRVCKWTGIPDNVITRLISIMRKWKTSLEIWKDGEKSISRCIDKMCGFLQGDSYSPVGFCIS